MNWYHIVHNTYRGLLQHKLRSLLSTLGIVFAVMAVVAMLSIAEGAKHETMKQIEQLGMNNITVRPIPLTAAQMVATRERLSHGLIESDAELLERGLPNVSLVAPLKEVRAALPASDEEGLLQILGVTESYRLVNGLSIQHGRFIHDLDVNQKNLICVLGEKAAKLLGSEGRLGRTLHIEDRAYRIVGILQERQLVRGKIPALTARNYNRAVFIPLGTEPPVFQLREELGELSEISVQVMQGNSVQATALVVKRILTRNHGGVEDFQIIIPQELLMQAQKTQRVFNIVLGCIAGISLLVGGIGIMNIMLANVAERTREIGIRRAIGANQKHIILQFLSESILLTMVGGIFGIVLGVGASFTISTFAGWTTMLTMWSIVMSMVMAMGVGLFAGLYPAIRAAQLDPVAALRYE